MSHRHDSCVRPTGGLICTSGHLTGYCDWPDCDNEYCEDYGHCDCGHLWPRMLKSVRNQEGGAA